MYQLVKFGDLMSSGSEDIFKKPVSCTNTHHEVTDLVNHGMVKNTETWISRERNITLLQNEKNLNLCFRWQFLRSYRFVAELTFNYYNSSFHRTNRSQKIMRFSYIAVFRTQSNLYDGAFSCAFGRKIFSQKSFRSNNRKCSAKKSILKNFPNFTGKHLCWSLFLINLQTFKPATLLKRDSNTSVFMWNLSIF